MSEFSEATYAFAVTQEIVGQLGGVRGLVALPLFPTLQDEARDGFDAKLSHAWAIFYLQYKVPKLVDKPRARQRKHFGCDYFRFRLKTSSEGPYPCQHNVLCHLASKNAGRTSYVQYAAPAFVTNDDLYRYMRDGTVVDHSAFVPPSRLGVVAQGSAHCCAYTAPSDARFFSTPTEDFDSSFPALAADLLVATGGDAIELGAFLESEFSRLRQAVSETLGVIADGRGVYTGPQSIAILAAQAGVQPWLVSRSQVRQQ